jgi:hypothetical protein
MPQGNSALFIDRTNSNGVLLFAIAAPPQEPLVTLSRFRIGHFVDFDAATLYASGRIAPPLEFKELHSRQFVRAGGWNLLYHFRLREVVAVFLHVFNFVPNATLRQVKSCRSAEISCVKYKIAVKCEKGGAPEGICTLTGLVLARCPPESKSGASADFATGALLKSWWT